MLKWVVIELTSKGDKENPDEVCKALQKVLRGADVYIPAVETQIGDDTVVHYLMRGYAFIKHTFEDRLYFRLENTKYVQMVLAAPGSSLSNRKVATVENSYIEDMQEKIRAEVNQGIGVGDTVRICSGPYKNITAKVITEIPEEKQVQVHVQLRSKEAILTLPRSVLEVVDRAPLSNYYARIGYLRAWLQMAKVVLSYNPPHRVVQDLHQRYLRVSAWLQKGKMLYSFIYSANLDERRALLLKRRELLLQVEDWFRQGKQIATFLYQDQLVPDARLAAIQAKTSELQWILGVEDRLVGISHEVEEISRSLERAKKGTEDMIIQNILIDGFNLAFRCYYAPGMGELQDDEGRPSGVLLGFLKSLGSLKKRYPEAKFWVSWDGSAQRRKSVYPDYKGNRQRSDRTDIFSQMDELKKVLPLLGVRQVWNPEEEADDVIATMVRGELEGQVNLIYSTDRDFIQLVSDHTYFLYPAVGSRREVMYDIEAVENTFGVPPNKVLELRSFFGDESDNLPGVPRVPKKVLKALLQTYGSVKGVYASGLAGVTKVQYERLRSAEPQVRINRDLMSLVDVSVTRTDPDVDVDGAAAMLRGRAIKPDPILDAFFGKKAIPSEAVA